MTGRRATGLPWAALAIAAAAIVACGGAGSEEFPRVVSLGEGEVFARVLNSSLAAGDNRMILQFEDADGSPVLDGSAHLRFYDLSGDDARLHFETDARFISTELSYIDEQSPGKPRESAGQSGAYVTQVSFDRAGEWGMKVALVTNERSYDEFPFRFSVREGSDEPSVGDAAPASRQAVLADVASIEEIDSSNPPRPHMHDITVADAIASGRPSVVAFATPAFCRSRTCGPVMENVLDPLYARYAGRAHFIHIEPYALSDLRSGFAQNPVPATREWNLHAEPWVFVIDRDGRIAAKFEGIVAADEVEAVLIRALGEG